MIEAARKYNVRVQVGFQSRSGNNMQEAMKFLHDGGIGEVYMARGLCYKLRDSYGIAKDSTPPASFHYDRWLGPAPYRPYNEKRSHYCWHWYWDTGNGDTGNQGPHQFDIARWDLIRTNIRFQFILQEAFMVLIRMTVLLKTVHPELWFMVR